MQKYESKRSAVRPESGRKVMQSIQLMQWKRQQLRFGGSNLHLVLAARSRLGCTQGIVQTASRYGGQPVSVSRFRPKSLVFFKCPFTRSSNDRSHGSEEAVWQDSCTDMEVIEVVLLRLAR